MAQYGVFITSIGQSKLALAAVSGPPVQLTQMAVGDSNGVAYDPDEAQTALVNPLHTGDLTVEVLSGGVIAAQMTIPVDVGGWHVREAGVFDNAGDLIAVVRLAERYKPLPSSQQADEMTIYLKLDVGNVGHVTWAVDPAAKDRIDSQLAPDYRSVQAIQSDPPGAPEPGQTFIVGDAPTGDWVGRENHLAEWSGTGWTFCMPTPWFHAGLADRTDWRWDHTLAEPAWVKWNGVDFATVPEHVEGEADDKAAHPLGVKAMIAANQNSHTNRATRLFARLGL
jgi:hypothetical protein